MFNLDLDEVLLYNESTKERQKKDIQDEDSLVSTLFTFKLLSNEMVTTVHNIAMKDLATEEIEHDLLHDIYIGREQTNRFVDERLLPCEQRKTKLHDTLHKKRLNFLHCIVQRRKM